MPRPLVSDAASFSTMSAMSITAGPGSAAGSAASAEGSVAGALGGRTKKSAMAFRASSARFLAALSTTCVIWILSEEIPMASARDSWRGV